MFVLKLCRCSREEWDCGFCCGGHDRLSLASHFDHCLRSTGETAAFCWNQRVKSAYVGKHHIDLLTRPSIDPLALSPSQGHFPSSRSGEGGLDLSSSHGHGDPQGSVLGPTLFICLAEEMLSGSLAHLLVPPEDTQERSSMKSGKGPPKNLLCLILPCFAQNEGDYLHPNTSDELCASLLWKAFMWKSVKLSRNFFLIRIHV